MSSAAHGELLGLCLAGPTASGKTAVALALAAELPLEVISVDSALVYRGMDIGTAKPTAAERAAVPHHMVDILDPTETYSAARFVADAGRLAAEIRARGRLPLLVGGTMLYFKALRQGLDAMPTADAAVRAAIDRRAAEQGWPALHAELARVDPATAARLAPADAQRIQRALEVWQLSGRPLSAWHQQQAHSRTETVPVPQAWPLVALEPAERGWLHARIAQRLDTMLASGLVDEVRALRARGDLHAGLPSMRCVGYRQVWHWLDQTGSEDPARRCAAPAEPDTALHEPIRAATRQLAKRQLTWLRSIPDRIRVCCDAADATEQALQQLRALAFGATRPQPPP